MGKRRNLSDDISDIRGRLRFGSAYAEVTFRRWELARAFAHREQADPEFRRYFPVTLVALIEGFFRLVVKEFVDAGTPYLDRVAKFTTSVKFEYEILKSLQGKKITLGELIAHSLPWNNLAQVNANLSALIDKDFLTELRTVSRRRPNEVLGGHKPPLLSDPDTTLRNVERLFELRHIICHEIASGFEVLSDEIDDCYCHSTLFLDASSELISDVLNPNAPLTQGEINAEAGRRSDAAQRELDALNQKLLENLDNSRANEYTSVNKAWQNYIELASKFEADWAKGGSIWPTLYSGAAERLTREYIEYVQHLISMQRW